MKGPASAGLFIAPACQPPLELGERQRLHLRLRGRQRGDDDDFDAGLGVDGGDAHLRRRPA